MKKIFLLAALSLAVLKGAFAVIAYPGIINFTQPDNKTTLQIYLFGDERFHWGETLDGYSLMHDSEGYFVYATKNENGEMVPTQYRATEIADRPAEVVAFLERTPKHLRYTTEQCNMMRTMWNMINDNPNIQTGLKRGEKALDVTHGNTRLLVILVNFSDRHFMKARTDVDKLYNQVNYSNVTMRGSVHDFYYENSYGQMNLTFEVVGPYSLPQTISYYGNNTNGNSQEFAHDAIQLAVDDGVDLSQYDLDGDNNVDGVHIMFAGYGEESSGTAAQIWSHKGTLTHPVYANGVYAKTYSCSPELHGGSGTVLSTVGVICHELGHVFGAPDYYDVDNNHGGSGTAGYAANGQWDLMSSGSWNGSANALSGNQPSHHNPFSKCVTYGWGKIKEISSPQALVLNPSSNDSASIYKVTTATTNEYYLLENRQQLGFDGSLPGHGLIIYHVHANFNPANQNNNVNHPLKFYPVCAGISVAQPNSDPSSYGNINSSACPFPGSSRKTTFADNTYPSMKSWSGANTNKPISNITENTTLNTISFTFNGSGVDASNAKAVAHNRTQVEVEWRIFGAQEVMLVYSPNGTFGTPSGNYTVGQSITGGGTVLYIGDALSYTHTGLSAGTTYRYKIFTKLSNTPTWSNGVTCSTTTPTCATASIPYTQQFANNTFPSCWTRETTNNSVNWQIGAGNGANFPASAASAPYNAYCNTSDRANIGSQATLITEPIDLSSVSDANIKFKYCNNKYTAYQDVLTVAYRSSYDDAWTPLATFNKSVTSWTEVQLNLPNISDYYQIAFIATTNMGRGACIDDITISQGHVAIEPATATNPRITMYPNPASSTVTLSIEGNDNQSTFTVFDLTGKALMNGTMQGNEKKTISTGNLKSGMYFVRFQNDSYQKTETLIIK